MRCFSAIRFNEQRGDGRGLAEGDPMAPIIADPDLGDALQKAPCDRYATPYRSDREGEAARKDFDRTRNVRGLRAVAIPSARALADAPVSTPLRCKDVALGRDP